MLYQPGELGYQIQEICRGGEGHYTRESLAQAAAELLKVHRLYIDGAVLAMLDRGTLWEGRGLLGHDTEYIHVRKG